MAHTPGLVVIRILRERDEARELNAKLLEALKELVRASAAEHVGQTRSDACAKARAAIAEAEGRNA